MAKDRAARKAAKAGKGAAAEAGAKAGKKGGKKAGGKAGKKADKKQNPVVKRAREQYIQELKKQGVPEDQLKQKVHAQLKDVIKPAMKQAKESAKTKNLTGKEKRKFIEEAVRSKLSVPA
jgi:hypothetical protein